MKTKKTVTTLSALAVSTALPAFGEAVTEKKSDGDWIMLTGKVKDVRAHSFQLDYTNGTILVELDNYDAKPIAGAFSVDQPVMIHGRVDKDGQGATSIEALRVYTLDTQKTYSGNSDDEEGVVKAWRADKSTTSLTGKVTEIIGTEMKVDTNFQTFTVDTSLLPEKAFDNEGNIQISLHDQVNVYGTFSDGFEKTSTLRAVTIDETKKPEKE